MTPTAFLRQQMALLYGLDQTRGDTVEVALDSSGTMHVEIVKHPKGIVRQVQVEAKVK